MAADLPGVRMVANAVAVVGEGERSEFPEPAAATGEQDDGH